MIDITTTVEKGRLPSIRSEQIRDYLKSLEGRQVHIKIEPKRKNRSLSQNRYYWYMMEFIAKELGYDGEYDSEVAAQLKELATPEILPRMTLLLNLLFRPKLGREEVHEIFRGMFLVDPDGKPKSSAGLSTDEAEEYYQKIRDYCARELGIIVPEPNQTEWL